MSTKLKRSKVSVNVMSSEEDIDSDLNETNSNISEDNDNKNDIESDNVSLNGNNLNENSNTTTNTSWADAINKVLSTKTKNKTFLLSKAKKDKTINLKRKSDVLTDDLEFVKEDGTVVHNKSDDKTIATNENNKKKKNKTKLTKKEWEVMSKLKPKLEDKDRERMLCSIATKGVVQLFNAVKEQQKTIENKFNEIGSSETKRDKLLTQFNKTQFLDKLKAQETKTKDKSNDSNGKQSVPQKWKVLRDDFMIGAKMKDWDKQSDSDEQSED